MNNNKVIKAPSSHRKISLTAGILYLLTFISIPTVALYGQAKSANYITGIGPDTDAIIGGALEIFMALACIGSAVVLFQILKKQNEGLALSLVAARILEAATIFVGVAFILSIVILRQEGVGTSGLDIGHTLSVLYDRIFLLGQSFMPAINDVLLGVLLYKSRLIPRTISMIGIIGGPILAVGYIAILFGVIGQHAPLAGLSALPVALFEFTLGIWLVVKGFNHKAVAVLEAKD